MATESARTKLEAYVEFYREPDGQITAVDSETGRARGGDTRGEALCELGEVLILLAGGGEPIEDEDAALREIGIDPDEIPDNPEPLPDFMQQGGIVQTTFSGREVAKVLRRFGWRLTGGPSAHRVFRYENHVGWPENWL